MKSSTNISIKKKTHIAMMVCMIIICSWLTIPAPVPFTMQTFAVFCSLLLLGGKSGLATVIIYTLLGCIGLPVFSGFQSGMGYIVGPTGGYIIGFIFTAAFYSVFEPLLLKRTKLRIPILAGGLLLCYLTGTIWFLFFYKAHATSYSIGAAILLCILPYIIPDLIKLSLALYISKRIHKAFGDL